MLKPALYKNKKAIAMYAAALFPFFSKTALVIVMPMFEQIMPTRDTIHKDLLPILSASSAPAMETKKFQICIPPLIPVCWLVPVTLSEVRSGEK